MWTCSSVPYLSPRQAGQADAWTDQTAEAGRVGTQDLRQVEALVPPAEVAEALRLAPGEAAILRSRIMRLDGTPIEFADSWYPLRVAEDTPLAEKRKIRGGAVSLLASLGYLAHEAREDISVRPADADEAGELGISKGDPLIVLFRATLTPDGTPFEVSVMRMVAAGRHLAYRLMVG